MLASWAIEEMKTADLEDKRLNERLTTLLSAFGCVALAAVAPHLHRLGATRPPQRLRLVVPQGVVRVQSGVASATMGRKGDKPMSLVLDLPPDLETALAAEAARLRLPLPEYALGERLEIRYPSRRKGFDGEVPNQW